MEKNELEFVTTNFKKLLRLAKNNKSNVIDLEAWDLLRKVCSENSFVRNIAEIYESETNDYWIDNMEFFGVMKNNSKALLISIILYLHYVNKSLEEDKLNGEFLKPHQYVLTKDESVKLLDTLLEEKQKEIDKLKDQLKSKESEGITFGKYQREVPTGIINPESSNIKPDAAAFFDAIKKDEQGIIKELKEKYNE